MSINPAAAALVIRLSAGTRRRPFVLAPICAATILVPAAGIGGVTAFAVAAAVVAVLSIPGFLYVYRTRVIVTDAEFGRVGLLGRPRMRRRADAGSVVRATLPPLRGMTGPYHNVFICDVAGKPLLRLHTGTFAPSDLDRFVARLGLPVREIEGVITPARLGEIHPGIVPWWERRPVTAALVLILAILAAVLLGVPLVAFLRA
ncbi:hypothetical protein [Actinopolymorpha alba]|uniref:hypothetical protein n=1 Tax=Actinopolymorpha alba TaxID=533267 RepID=UPI00036D167B|nr:hypothetical protein [Actinopolymorpha alba]